MGLFAQNDPRGADDPGNIYFNPYPIDNMGNRTSGHHYDLTPISPKAFRQLAISCIVLFFICLFL